MLSTIVILVYNIVIKGGHTIYRATLAFLLLISAILNIIKAARTKA